MVQTQPGRVLTFGEPLVVCVPSQEGKLSSVRDFHTDCAGAELNTAIGLARLEVLVSYAALVGADPFGDLIRRSLRAEGGDDSLLSVSEAAPTGIYFKQWSGLERDAQVFYYRSNSAMATQNWDVQLILEQIQSGEFTWVHATGITWMISPAARERCLEIFKCAHENGVPVSFDANIRLKLASIEHWRQAIRETLPFVTWYLLGDTEAAQLYGTDVVQAVEQVVRGQGFVGSGVIVKCGSDGAKISRNGEAGSVGAWPVERVIDTVGAGDGFNAGWIAGMIRGWDMQACVTLGSLVGAYAVTSSGDSDGYPSWAEVIQKLEGKEGIMR